MRTTFDKKDYSLRIRLNDVLHSHLTENARKRGRSVSEYVRELIVADMKAKKTQ